MDYSAEFLGLPLIVTVEDGVIKKISYEKNNLLKKNKEIEREILKFWKGEESSLSFVVEGLSEKVQKILYKAAEIPFGKVSSYGDISKAVFGSKKYSRLVGYAMSVNPLSPIVPCHRVIHSNGEVWGFTGSLKYKIKLLGLEGVPVNNGKVDKAFFARL